MIQVQRMRLREIRLCLREPFRISSGTTMERRVLLVELEDASGAHAWSECVAGERPDYGPETVDTAWLAVRRWLGPALLGRRLDGPREVEPLLRAAARGHRMARAALEMGCWLLSARKRGLPLAEALGGTRDRIATGISIGIQESPGELARKARRAKEEGYRKVKVKIRPGADLEHVAAARNAVGPGYPLAVDANAAYGLDDADRLQRLDDFALLMVEQPLGAGDLRRHALLQERLETPLCLDESITAPDRAEDMIELGSGRIVNVKAGRMGGLGPSLRTHDLCEERDVPVWCGGMLETGVGRAYNVALASLPNFVLPGDVSPSRRYWERDIVDPEWTMAADGTVAVPRDRPGLGVRVDRERVEDLTVRTATHTSSD